MLAELRVAVAIGVLCTVLLVQQRQGDAGLHPLGVNQREVGQRTSFRTGPRRRRPPIQPLLELLLRQALDRLPVQTGLSRAPDRLTDRTEPDVQGRRDVAVVQPLPVSKPKYFSDFSHG